MRFCTPATAAVRQCRLLTARQPAATLSRRWFSQVELNVNATPLRRSPLGGAIRRRGFASEGGGGAVKGEGGGSSSTTGGQVAAPAAAPPAPMRGPVTWGAVGIAGVTAAGLVWYYQSEKERRQTQKMGAAKSFGKPALGGPWSLVDMHGAPRTDRDYRGRFTLLYFGFTHCPDICPSELVKVGNVIEELDKRLGPGVVKPVFISVDPERDSLQQLRHYAQDFHPSIDYLTGTKEQVARAAKAYRVYFSKADDHDEGEDYLVDHSIVLYLNGPDNDFLDFLTQRTTPADCLDRIAAAVEQRRREPPAPPPATPPPLPIGRASGAALSPEGAEMAAAKRWP